MSVLIKDMEKPKSCRTVIDGEFEYCPFLNTDCDCVLLLKKGICDGTWEGQYSKCPLIEATEPKWIPCKERLPIEARHYLCSFNRPNRVDRIYVDLAYWTGGSWYGFRQDQINAWMPLPEPYRREGDE